MWSDKILFGKNYKGLTRLSQNFNFLSKTFFFKTFFWILVNFQNNFKIFYCYRILNFSKKQNGNFSKKQKIMYILRRNLHTCKSFFLSDEIFYITGKKNAIVIKIVEIVLKIHFVFHFIFVVFRAMNSEKHLYI